jgi:hypothetical protein
MHQRNWLVGGKNRERDKRKKERIFYRNVWLSKLTTCVIDDGDDLDGDDVSFINYHME